MQQEETGKQYVDISIVAIPSQEFAKEKQNIIIDNPVSNKLMLNTEFIAGYVTVDTKMSTLESYVENPKHKCLNKEDNSQKVSDEIKIWLQRLDKWEAQTRNLGIRNSLMSIFRNLSLKDKIKTNDEITQEIPRNIIKRTYNEGR